MLSTHYQLQYSLVVVGLMAFPLHIFVSNQSLEYPVSVIEIEIDGKQIFQRQMTTGFQDNWEEIKEVQSISGGEHTLHVLETNTNVSRFEQFTVDRESWIVITFHGPQVGIKVDFQDHPVGFI